MSHYYTVPLVIESELAAARQMLGDGLGRIIGYYEEDGGRSIGQIEQALAGDNAVAMVIPAHTLKGESRQFGAQRVGDLAEVIEKVARHCVEQHSLPHDVASEIAMLRRSFHETLDILKAAARAASPPAAAPPRSPATPPAPGPRTFGRRVG